MKSAVVKFFTVDPAETAKAYFVLVALLGVLAIAAILRLTSIADTPAWYTDEGFYFRLASDMMQGRLSTFVVQQWTFISPFATAAPLYPALLAGLMLIFGKTLMVARYFSALAGLATIASLYYIGKQLYKDVRVGLLLAAAYAFLPILVVNNRWGFPQTIAGLLVLWGVYAIWRGDQEKDQRKIFYGALSLSGAYAITFWVWPLTVILFFFFLRKGFIKSALYALAPMLLTVCLIALRAVAVPKAFDADFSAMISGYAMLKATLGDFMFSLYTGAMNFFTRDILFFLGFVGTLFMRPARLRWLVFFSCTSMLLLMCAFRYDVKNFFYPFLALTPLLLLGLGGLSRIIVDLEVKIKSKIFMYSLVLCFGYLAIQGIVAGDALLRHSMGSLVAKHTFITEEAVKDMRAVSDYVNSHTQSNAFVIAPNNLGWRLHVKTVPMVWVACWEYQKEYAFLWDTRFAYPAALQSADYYIDDSTFVGDASVCFSHREELVKRITQGAWPVVFNAGRFVVYKNPN